MSLRLFVDVFLSAETVITLPVDAARHVQVRRLQPGDMLCLFDGRAGEWQAKITQMERRDVHVHVQAHHDVDRELAVDLDIALGMPTNERMDTLIEKATELGVRTIQPLHSERSVLRLDGERAVRRVAHWQAVAIAAAEQSGRTRVPIVAPVCGIAAWLAALPPTSKEEVARAEETSRRYLMSTGTAPCLAQILASAPHFDASRPTQRPSWLALSGPEGGLTRDEEDAARTHDFRPISLGPSILRADTAPLAWLSQMAALMPARH